MKPFFTDENKPQWNMNEAFFMRLDKRLDERDQARIQGNLLGWFRGQRAIFTNIHFKVKEKGHEEEEEKLNEQFEKAKNLLFPSQTKNARVNHQLQNLTLTKVEIVLDEIDITLNDLLYEYGFILPKNATTPWGEKVANSY